LLAAEFLAGFFLLIALSSGFSWEAFMRYLAAAVFGILGMLFFVSSVVAGVGVHGSGHAIASIPLAMLGTGSLVLSQEAVRDLYGEPLVRGIVNFILLIGSVLLIPSLGMLWIRAFSAGDGDSPFYEVSLTSLISLGALSIGALIFINHDAKKHAPR
jgi:hypothetical protein